MINAPVLVLTAAGLSIIARGGIVRENKDAGPAWGEVETFKFWSGILFATGGIILIDKYNANLAKGMATLWIIGGVVINGPKIVGWLQGFGEGIK